MNRVGLYRFVTENASEIVERGFAELGLDRRLQGIRTVFIKPNLVTDVEEYIQQGANTDLRIIEAVLRYLGRFPNRRVVLGESETGTNVKGRRLERALQIMGVLELQKRYPFTICNLTRDQQVRVQIPGGQLIRSLSMGRTIMESDLIIDLPKIKTHKYATVTCALKNMFGVIPDPRRVIWHQDIHYAVSDINRLFQGKIIVVTDGLTAMEGAGPLFGSRVPLNVILVADDPVANDIVAARIMDIVPAKIKHLVLCQAWSGVRPETIRLVGDTTIEAVRRPFAPARQNAFIWLEGRLMRQRWIVRILFNEWFQRNITFRFRGLLKRLRGGSYRWYLNEDDDKKSSDHIPHR